MMFSLWAFFNNGIRAKNITDEGIDKLEEYVQRMCNLLDIDYEMDIKMQLEDLERIKSTVKED